jgi:hypothetical protein
MYAICQTGGMKTIAESLRELADGEMSALVIVEAAERLAARAVHAIGDQDPLEAQRLLLALVGLTSARSATAVKDQHVSDAIAQRAAETVRSAVEREPRPERLIQRDA